MPLLTLAHFIEGNALAYDTISVMSNEINTYVLSQLQAGLNPAEITQQLRTAGWPEETIQQAFTAAQTQLNPAPVATPVFTATSPQEQPVQQVADTAAPAQATLPAPIKRGRLRTGWMLFTQSLRVIRGNKGLSRYMVVNMLLSLLLFVIVAGAIVADQLSDSHVLTTFVEDYDGSTQLAPTLPGIILLVVSGILGTFINYFYATALAAHVLSIFRGKPGTYKEYIAVARQKIPAIFTYALIATVVGYILRALEERFRIVGWIISKIMGLLWALGTTFVIAIIADTNQNGVSAIKSSISLFKQNWGETITGRVAMTGLIVLVYVLVGFPLAIIAAIVLGGLFGIVGIIVAVTLWIIGFIIIGILETLATNILNVGLYYYAQYKTIPPSFSPELLASALVPKKK